MNHPHPIDPMYDSDDEIDLRQLIRNLWQQKRIILALSILGMIAGIGASLYSTKYVTDLVVIADNAVSSDTYNTYHGFLANRGRLQNYLTSSNQKESSGGETLWKLSMSTTALENTFKPFFRLTEKDKKFFGIGDRAQSVDTFYGINIHLENKGPTDGEPASILIAYIQESIGRMDMEREIPAQCTLHQIQENAFQTAQLDDNFAIEQEEKRGAVLRDIIARNPDASPADNRQIISLEKSTERYLSPRAQLLASEVQVANMRLSKTARDRDRDANALKKDYYCQALEALPKAPTIRAFLNDLKTIQANLFKDKDMSVNIIKKTSNELAAEQISWKDLYFEKMRPVISPKDAEIKRRKPGPVLALVLGGMLGGIFGMFAALVRTWWREPEPSGSPSTAA